MFYDDDDDDDKDHDDGIVRASSVLHRTPLMMQLEEVERDMRKNHRAAQEMIRILERDVALQATLRRQTAIAMDRLKLVKADMISQLNQARRHYEEDMRTEKARHAVELGQRDATIARLEEERASVRRTAARLVRLAREKLRSKLKQLLILLRSGRRTKAAIEGADGLPVADDS